MWDGRMRRVSERANSIQSEAECLRLIFLTDLAQEINHKKTGKRKSSVKQREREKERRKQRQSSELTDNWRVVRERERGGPLSSLFFLLSSAIGSSLLLLLAFSSTFTNTHRDLCSVLFFGPCFSFLLLIVPFET